MSQLWKLVAQVVTQQISMKFSNIAGKLQAGKKFNQKELQKLEKPVMYIITLILTIFAEKNLERGKLQQ